MNNTYNFEIREIDAWFYDDLWQYNSTFHVCYGKTKSENISRVFYRILKKHGIYLKVGKTMCVCDDGSIYEIIDRKTKEPLFCLIPEY